MRKYFSLVSIWILSLSFLFLPSSASLVDVDPTDDFSFSLGHYSKGEIFHFMSEETVSSVLADRLDLFPQSQVPRLARHIITLCQRFRLDPAYVLSLMQVESGFRIKAVSPVGAVGLMQLMIPTAQFVARKQGIQLSGHEPFLGYGLNKGELNAAKVADPYVNTSLGIAYLAFLRDAYRGMSPYYVLAAYNVGPARMNELLARKSFQAVETKKYFLNIRRGVPDFRSYRSKLKI